MPATTTDTSATKPALAVSLEPHLVETLRPLLSLLPQKLADELKSFLVDDNGSPSRAIPHALLSSISSWARSAQGERVLTEHEPPLRSIDYGMISLLAGTRTSPDKRFPDVPATTSALQDARREISDRRAVTAILNALLSIGGSGAATWWAAGRLTWKDEWKVLLALLVATVVAVSEIVLYMIWDARHSGKSVPVRTKTLAVPSKRYKNRKTEDYAQSKQEIATLSSGVITTATSLPDDTGRNTLRERIISGETDSDSRSP